MTPFWQENLRTINLTVKLGNIEQEIIEANNDEWMFQFNVPYTIRRIQDVLDELNFWYEGCLYFVSDVYWSGCLTAEPWCKLELPEEDILNKLLKYHTEITTTNGEHVIRFKMNTKSPLHKFFLEHQDGYGGNIPYSYGAMLWKVEEAIDRYLEKELENQHTRLGVGYSAMFCGECGVSYFGYEKCPECDTELEWVLA